MSGGNGLFPRCSCLFIVIRAINETLMGKGGERRTHIGPQRQKKLCCVVCVCVSILESSQRGGGGGGGGRAVSVFQTT